MAILDMFSLVGKKGFITGAAQGIGKCLAENFAEAGADVAVVDIDGELADKTATEIAAKTGRVIKAYQCDVTKAEDVAVFMNAYIADFGTIDFAINNAGIATFDNAMDIDPETFRRVIDVNLIGVFNTAQAAARTMEEAGYGRINHQHGIDVSSYSKCTADYRELLRFQGRCNASVKESCCRMGEVRYQSKYCKPRLYPDRARCVTN